MAVTAGDRRTRQRSAPTPGPGRGERDLAQRQPRPQSLARLFLDALAGDPAFLVQPVAWSLLFALAIVRAGWEGVATALQHLVVLALLVPMLLAVWLERRDEGIRALHRRWLPMTDHGGALLLWTYGLLAASSILWIATTWASFWVANQIFSLRRLITVPFVLTSVAVQIGGVVVLIYGALQRVYRFPADYRRSFATGPLLALAGMVGGGGVLIVSWRQALRGGFETAVILEPAAHGLAVGATFATALALVFAALWTAIAAINRSAIPLPDLHRLARRRRRERDVF